LKSSLILLFSIFIISVSIQAEAQLEPTLTLDRESYGIYDTIIITGNTSYPEESITILLLGNAITWLLPTGLIQSDVNSNFYYEIDIFNLVDINDNSIRISSGDYTFRVFDLVESEYFITIPFKITGELMKIQTDKQEYYLNENISINGTITEIDESADTTITYDITYSNEIIQTGNDTLQEDGTFNFTIDTIQWDHTGTTTVNVTIQNSTANTTFQYYNTVDMSPESNYEKIMIQQDTDEKHDKMLDAQNITMYNQDTMMYSQQDDIIQIKKEQTEQRSFIDMILSFLGLSGDPPQSDPPIIIALVADDPDDLDDTYSIDDTISILFDSCTNEPGGTGFQTKNEVNDLFTFSEVPAQAYNGIWVFCDEFVITVKSVNNAGITIGTTRVTPAGTTPILPADHTPDASYLISPVLVGDWGVLLPEGYIQEPQVQCGRGTILINGYCKVL